MRTNKGEGAATRTLGFFEKIKEAILASIKKRSGAAPIYDIAVAVVALLVARCHVIFGAYPLGIAMIAILPERVWVAVLGAVIGSLTLGKAGIVYALIAIIVAFLRMIISGTSPSGAHAASTASTRPSECWR